MVSGGTKKWVLYATIGILLLAIVGLTTAIAINFLRGDQNISRSEGAEKIMSDFQKKIDVASSDSEKQELYVDRAYHLKQYMNNYDEDLCAEMKADLESAKKINGGMNVDNLEKGILSSCMKHEGFSTTTIGTGDDNE